MQFSPDQPVTILVTCRLARNDIQALQRLGYANNNMEFGMPGGDGGSATIWNELYTSQASVFIATTPDKAAEIARRIMPDVVLVKDDANGHAFSQALPNESSFIVHPVRPGDSAAEAIAHIASLTPGQRRQSPGNSAVYSQAVLAAH